MQNKNELVITRVFDAPVATVWKYWTEPDLLKKWWGPKIFTCPFVKIDFRVGGKYLSCMRGSPVEGAPVQDFWSTGTYKEIVPVKKIVATDSFADEKGNVISASHYGMEGFPMELEVTIMFEEKDGKTTMTLRHVGMPAGENHNGANQSWNQSFDKLAEIL